MTLETHSRFGSGSGTGAKPKGLTLQVAQERGQAHKPRSSHRHWYKDGEGVRRSLIVGAPQGVNDGGPGKAYLFRMDIDGTGEWVEEARVTASDASPADNFGWSMSEHSGVAVFGAPGDDNANVDAGTSYVFELRCECRADFDDDGTVDSRDFIVFLNAFVLGDPVADFNVDGQVNGDDFAAYLNAFVAGC
jgi:hypothetical protein